MNDEDIFSVQLESGLLLEAGLCNGPARRYALQTRMGRRVEVITHYASRRQAFDMAACCAAAAHLALQVALRACLRGVVTQPRRTPGGPP